MEKPCYASQQKSLDCNTTNLRNGLSPADSVGSLDTQELIEKSKNLVEELSSIEDATSGPRDVNEQVRATTQSPLFDSVAKCEFTPQTRRYPTRRRVSLGEDSPHCGGEQRRPPSKEISQKDAHSFSEKMIKTSNRKSDYDGKLNGKRTNTETAKGDETSKSKIGGKFKRKLCTEGNSNSQCPTDNGDNNGDMISWLRGTQIEDICLVEDHKGDEAVARKVVRDILQLFHMISERLLLDEETRLKCPIRSTRVDLMALKLLKHRFTCLNHSKKYLGKVPGVEVGDLFHYRAELSVIGLHRNLQAGIEYIKHDGRIVAASIVSCGGYDDIMENSDMLIYSGSGGHAGSTMEKEKLLINQKLEGGNLALKNSIEACTPVRVIYGLKEENSSDSRAGNSKKTLSYIYDGLYIVEKYWLDSQINSFSTFKFQLRRISGQPNIGIKELMNLKPLKMRHGLRMEDISEGKENKPITVVNTVDTELPLPFTYITRMIYPSWYKLTPPKGCDCVSGCSDLVKCDCVVKNGGEIPFNSVGAIVEAKPLVYECGPSCQCPPSCQNKVSQHGIKLPLEVFKTKSRGWGVRCLAKISSGTFICEYIGEMLEDAEAEKRENDEYLFDIGKNYNDEALWEGLSSIPNLRKTKPLDDIEEGFTVDAANFANVGRFINHSCTPNLYAQNLIYDHDDQSMPHIMLFASEDISPFEELTYHYNYNIDRVQGPDGKVKKKDCYCGSVECTGRLY